MNNLLNSLKQETNYTYTTNGAVAHKSTLNKVLDLFALGGAYRAKSDNDVILLFKEAYDENPELALKCLFFIRDIRGNGYGERRFFRVCIRWLAKEHPEVVKRNINYIPFVGRYDDLYALMDTPCMLDAFTFFDRQLRLDMECQTPSLCAKWIWSMNCSSAEHKKYGKALADYMRLTPKQYRKMLTGLRAKIKIVETLMSQNRWQEIQFDKLPSKAGFKYRNAFAKNDYTKERYEAFMKSKTTKVNAKTLFPYEVVKQAIYADWQDELACNTLEKYWENLADYFNNATFNALAVVDTSGSMCNGAASAAPIDVAISLGMYCAEKANGPFKNHYISFSSKPQLIEIKGINFVDKVQRIYQTNLCENTNIEATFDLLLNNIVKYDLKEEDIPEYLVIISDMQWDEGTREIRGWRYMPAKNPQTLIDQIKEKWKSVGVKMPKLIFWNVNAEHPVIPALDGDYSYISGFSPAIFEQIMTGKTGVELMLEALSSERYKDIH